MRVHVRPWLTLPIASFMVACSSDAQVMTDAGRSTIHAVEPLLNAILGVRQIHDGGAADAMSTNDATTADDVVMPPEDVATGTDATTPPEDTTRPPQDTGVTPQDSGTSTPVVLPAFDSATESHVRDIVARGVARGNRREVFAKIGDSITESQSFLFDCGYGWANLGAYSDLADTVHYYSTTAIGDRNSFNRASVCAVAGWTAAAALEGYPDAPLTRELEATRPMWAIVMYGTNDLQVTDIGTYTMNLSRVLDVIEQYDVVPVMSTIPPRADGEPYNSRASRFSDVVRSLAATRHLPLIDYNLALQPLPSYGLSPDGIHPNTYVDPTDSETDACDFTSAGLRFGYNMRGLTAIQMLARLRAY